MADPATISRLRTPNRRRVAMAALSMDPRVLTPIRVRLRLVVPRALPYIIIRRLTPHRGRRRITIRITGRSGRTTAGERAAGGAYISFSLETCDP